MKESINDIFFLIQVSPAACFLFHGRRRQVDSPCIETLQTVRQTFNFQLLIIHHTLPWP